jgi:hypothetical protein
MEFRVMSDRFTELLSGYLDHDLTRTEHDAVRRHLDECADCRGELSALADVKSRAASLVDPPAPTDLWAGIASRIGTAGSSSAAPVRHARVIELPRRNTPTWSGSQVLAAVATFVVVAGGALWLAHDRLSPALRPAASVTDTRTSGTTEATTATFDASRIEGEIGQLQRALDRGRGKLDPKTVQVLEENLRIIHKATEDARRALEQDPANADLQDYLAGSLQRKLDLVRGAAVMAGV